MVKIYCRVTHNTAVSSIFRIKSSFPQVGDGLARGQDGLPGPAHPGSGGLHQLVLHVHRQAAEDLGDDLFLLLVGPGILPDQGRSGGQTAAAQVLQGLGAAAPG